LQRRAAPESVAEVLEWAGEPLAAAEVAAIRGIDRDAAEAELAQVAVGHGGFWSLPAVPDKIAA
jgi:hypothetical protein